MAGRFRATVFEQLFRPGESRAKPPADEQGTAGQREPQILLGREIQSSGDSVAAVETFRDHKRHLLEELLSQMVCHRRPELALLLGSRFAFVYRAAGRRKTDHCSSAGFFRRFHDRPRSFLYLRCRRTNCAVMRKRCIFLALEAKLEKAGQPHAPTGRFAR
jgi:hypothetical protein